MSPDIRRRGKWPRLAEGDTKWLWTHDLCLSLGNPKSMQPTQVANKNWRSHHTNHTQAQTILGPSSARRKMGMGMDRKWQTKCECRGGPAVRVEAIEAIEALSTQELAISVSRIVLVAALLQEIRAVFGLKGNLNPSMDREEVTESDCRWRPG